MRISEIYKGTEVKITSGPYAGAFGVVTGKSMNGFYTVEIRPTYAVTVRAPELSALTVIEKLGMLTDDTA